MKLNILLALLCLLMVNLMASLPLTTTLLAYLAIGFTNAVGLLLNHLDWWKDETSAFDVLVAYPLAVVWCVLVWPYALYHDYNLCLGADNE